MLGFSRNRSSPSHLAVGQLLRRLHRPGPARRPPQPRLRDPLAPRGPHAHRRGDPSKKFVRFNRQTINPFRSISTIFIMSGVLDLYASYLLTMHHTGILLDKSSSILREESQGSYTNSNDLLCTSCAIASCRT